MFKAKPEEKTRLRPASAIQRHIGKKESFLSTKQRRKKS